MEGPQPGLFGPYHNGKEFVYGDPLKILRTLNAKLDGDHDKWAQRTFSPDPAEKALALGRLAEATVHAFDMVPFNAKTGRGTTEEKAIELLQQYNSWVRAKKANTRADLTSPLSTASGESRVPMS